MKYRINLQAVFNNADANSILNHIESIKSSVFYSATAEVVIVRKNVKCEAPDSSLASPTIYASVDFDGVVDSHSTTHTGTEFEVNIDVSFSIVSDYNALLNYIETIKGDAISSSYNRLCRYFECNHDEVPLVKDSSYSYINFDGAQLTHPVV